MELARMDAGRRGEYGVSFPSFQIFGVSAHFRIFDRACVCAAVCEGGFRSGDGLSPDFVEMLLEAFGVHRERRGFFWTRGRVARATEHRGAVPADFRQ